MKLVLFLVLGERFRFMEMGGEESRQEERAQASDRHSEKLCQGVNDQLRSTRGLLLLV